MTTQSTLKMETYVENIQVSSKNQSSSLSTVHHLLVLCYNKYEVKFMFGDKTENNSNSSSNNNNSSSNNNNITV
jgi:hypothetical protein